MPRLQIVYSKRLLFFTLSTLPSIHTLGPAGGVVGYAMTSYSKEDDLPVIGFDMGGTSTDVSRYAGTFPNTEIKSCFYGKGCMDVIVSYHVHIKASFKIY